MSTSDYEEAILAELPKRLRLPMWWSATQMDGGMWIRGIGCAPYECGRLSAPPTDATHFRGNDLTSAVEMACWDAMVRDGFTATERRDAIGRLDVRLRARDVGLICVECGAWDVYVEQGRRRWYDRAIQAIERDRACFDCTHWLARVRALSSPHADSIVVSQSWNLYSIGAENRSENGFRGFGGTKWIVRFNDGRTLRTSNLWSTGVVPEVFRERLPQNAELVAVEGRSLLREWQELDCYPAGAKTPARTGLE
jgi:hypothetical protein